MGYLRALYDWPADGFDLDFRDRAAAQQIFEEGQGSLLTDGTRACMEASHLQYDQLLDAESGARGLRLLMDGDGITCGHSAQIAVGHLASWLGYSYGDFSWVARVAHSPGGASRHRTSSCFSTFVHGSLAHNELAWCFPAHDGSEVHMSYWFDEEMHRTARRLRFDATAGFHKYETRWRPQGIDWMVDGAVVHQVRGTAGKDIPWELMSMRVIIRPRNTPSVLLGVAHLELMQARFIPLGAEASPVTNAPSRQTPPPPPPPPPPLRRHPPPVPSPPRSARRRRRCRRRARRRIPHVWRRRRRRRTPPTTAPPPSPPPSAPPPRTQRQPPRPRLCRLSCCRRPTRAPAAPRKRQRRRRRWFSPLRSPPRRARRLYSGCGGLASSYPLPFRCSSWSAAGAAGGAAAKLRPLGSRRGLDAAFSSRVRCSGARQLWRAWHARRRPMAAAARRTAWSAEPAAEDTAGAACPPMRWRPGLRTLGLTPTVARDQDQP